METYVLEHASLWHFFSVRICFPFVTHSLTTLLCIAGLLNEKKIGLGAHITHTLH